MCEQGPVFVPGDGGRGKGTVGHLVIIVIVIVIVFTDWSPCT